jgi:FemAB-related protein (PEP-CTERM system-associated)
VITTDARPDEWDAFVNVHPDANRYQLWGWRRIFEDVFGHETIYLSARRGGVVVGVLPLVILRSRVFGSFAVSLPFVDGGGVCTSDGEAADLLVLRARQEAAERRLSHVELRHISRQFPELPVRQHKVGMCMPLAADAKQAWDALDRKVRNQVRKGEKSELATRSGGVELTDAFYEVFTRNMRDLGTPVYPRRLFEMTLRTFPESARVFVVDKGEVVVAAGIALIHRGVIAVPWASSLREYRALSANNLLYWRMIEHGIASRCHTFDFGRSTPGEGTFQFKEQWGAQPFPLYWEYQMLNGAAPPELNPGNPKFKAAIATWKRLPVPLTAWLGPRIVRSIP